MYSVFQFVFFVARYLGDLVSRHTMMNRILLVLAITTLSGAIEWENEVTINSICDNSTMHLNVNFSKEFQGTIYQSRGFYNPKCSFTVPFNTSVDEVNLSMPLGSCVIKIEEVDNDTVASSEVTIQFHSLLDSVYDKTMNVSCGIDNYHPVNASEEVNPFEGEGLDNSWIEFKNGLVLFGEVGQPTESTLFLVVNVRDGGFNQDMIVQNCIAHTDKNVTNTTTLHQLSNFYGCPDPLAILTNFTVIRPESDVVNIFAYAPIANFSVIASGGSISVSCGITLCENDCPAHCNDTESPIHLPLSDYVTKEVVTRSDGAILPDTLRELNRHNDRSRRTPNRPKRSIRSFFSSIFRWESRVLTGSVSEGNLTNITSTKKSEGLIVRHSLAARDVLASSNKHVNVKNTTSDFVEDQFYVDWVTFRFIALMTVCMFITILACYCCYSDKKSSGTSSLFL